MKFRAVYKSFRLASDMLASLETGSRMLDADSMELAQDAAEEWMEERYPLATSTTGWQTYQLGVDAPAERFYAADASRQRIVMLSVQLMLGIPEA